VVELARLESVCTFTRTEGSNPSLSAEYNSHTMVKQLSINSHKVVCIIFLFTTVMTMSRRDARVVEWGGLENR
jgi:hypothetical protein